MQVLITCWTRRGSSLDNHPRAHLEGSRPGRGPPAVGASGPRPPSGRSGMLAMSRLTPHGNTPTPTIPDARELVATSTRQRRHLFPGRQKFVNARFTDQEYAAIAAAANRS